MSTETETLIEQKKRLEAEMEANTKQRKELKKRLAAIETLMPTPEQKPE